MSFTETDLPISALLVDSENNTREDYGDVAELKARILALGLWGRIHVTEITDDGDGKKYSLENGFRRVTAVTELLSEGTTHAKTGQDLRILKAQVIPAGMSDTDRAELMLSLNTSQKSWTPYEQAKEIEYLCTNGVSMESIKERLGLKELAIKQRLNLLSAPEFLQEALAKNEVTATHARAILRIPNEDLQRDLTEKAVAQDLATRQIEEMAEAMVVKAVEQGAPAPTRGRKKKAAVAAKPKPQFPVRPAEEIIAEMETVTASMEDVDPVAKSELETYISALNWVLYDADLDAPAEVAPEAVEASTDASAEAAEPSEPETPEPPLVTEGVPETTGEEAETQAPA
jgi:ParB-like chromosome segregation protein Spo0J